MSTIRIFQSFCLYNFCRPYRFEIRDPTGISSHQVDHVFFFLPTLTFTRTCISRGQHSGANTLTDLGPRPKTIAITLIISAGRTMVRRWSRRAGKDGNRRLALWSGERKTDSTDGYYYRGGEVPCRRSFPALLSLRSPERSIRPLPGGNASAVRTN